jgi:hypothetical protein
MVGANPKPNPDRPRPLDQWRQWLEADALLSPGLRESYRQTLEGFERFCRQRASGTEARPTVALAREHVELQRLERAPGPAQLQEWKEALNWLFRHGRSHRSAALTGVPPLGRVDLGQTGWERRLVEKIRVRHLSWRTEQTYRGWAWRLARFLGERPVESLLGWHGHPDAAGVARASGCGHDPDLHARDAQARAGRAQPTGFVAASPETDWNGA